MTQETRLRIAMENLVDTMIKRKDRRTEAVESIQDSSFNIHERRALIMNENMMYLEDLNRAISFTLTAINTIMKED